MTLPRHFLHFLDTSEPTLEAMTRATFGGGGAAPAVPAFDPVAEADKHRIPTEPSGRTAQQALSEYEVMNGVVSERHQRSHSLRGALRVRGSAGRAHRLPHGRLFLDTS